MQQLQKLKCINALTLKIMAMVLMLMDHMWATVIPGNLWMNHMGRLAFPIFAFQIAEGYRKTRDRKKYRNRLFLFALCSEIPFNMMTGGYFINPFHQNVLFTFWLALLMLDLINWGWDKGEVKRWSSIAAACVLGWMLGILTMVDYGGYGVLTVLLFYFGGKLKNGWLLELAGLVLINGVLMDGMYFPVSIGSLSFEFPQQGLAVLALIPIWLYNGEQGPHNRVIQYVCYAFYPVHILILSILWLYVL